MSETHHKQCGRCNTRLSFLDEKLYGWCRYCDLFAPPNANRPTPLTPEQLDRVRKELKTL